MVAIPGIAYIIIGAGIAYVSRRFGSGEMNLQFFFWIGIAFIAIGVFKIVLRFITKLPKSGKKQDSAKATLKPINPNQESGKEISRYGKYCPACKLKYTKESHFCSKCGNKLYIK